jgi:hypothetical protein
MNKHHPSSPSESTFPYNDPDPEKLQEAADRALDYHLGTHPDPKPKPIERWISSTRVNQVWRGDLAKRRIAPLGCGSKACSRNRRLGS